PVNDAARACARDADTGGQRHINWTIYYAPVYPWAAAVPTAFARIMAVNKLGTLAGLISAVARSTITENDRRVPAAVSIAVSVSVSAAPALRRCDRRY